MSVAHFAISHWMPWKSAIGPAEGLAALHVLRRVHERALGETDAARGHDRTHRVERLHGEREAAADHLAGTDAHVVEDDLCGVDALHAHLLVDAWAASRRGVGVDDEAPDVAVLAQRRVTDLREDDEPVGLHAPRDPALGSVENEAARLVGVLAGARAHTRDVRTRAGFGEAEGGARRALGNAGEVALFLLFVAGDHDRARR